MLGAALGARIGKGRHRAVGKAQGDALHFDEGHAAGVFQAEIHPAALHAIWHLAAQGAETGQLADQPGTQRLFDQAVGPRGVDTGQAAMRRFTDLPGARQLALRVIGTAEPHPAALAHAIEHRAGVRAVDGQQLAGGGFDIGKEALVAAQ